jgi:hypothetical protein
MNFFDGGWALSLATVRNGFCRHRFLLIKHKHDCERLRPSEVLQLEQDDTNPPQIFRCDVIIDSRCGGVYAYSYVVGVEK